MKDVQIEVKPISNGVELRMVGEFNFCDAKDFMTEMPGRVKDKGRNIILNMEKLQFIDSAGLGAILYVSEACRMQFQTMKIINANESVKNLLSKIKGVGTFEL